MHNPKIYCEEKVRLNIKSKLGVMFLEVKITNMAL